MAWSEWKKFSGGDLEVVFTKKYDSTRTGGLSGTVENLESGTYCAVFCGHSTASNNRVLYVEGGNVTSTDENMIVTDLLNTGKGCSVKKIELTKNTSVTIETTGGGASQSTSYTSYFEILLLKA